MCDELSSRLKRSNENKMITQSVDPNYNNVVYDMLLTRKHLFRTKVVLCVIIFFFRRLWVHHATE